MAIRLITNNNQHVRFLTTSASNRLDVEQNVFFAITKMSKVENATKAGFSGTQMALIVLFFAVAVHTSKW